MKSSVHSQSSLHNIFQTIEISQTTAALHGESLQALLVAGKSELVADNGPNSTKAADLEFVNGVIESLPQP